MAVGPGNHAPTPAKPVSKTLAKKARPSTAKPLSAPKVVPEVGNYLELVDNRLEHRIVMVTDVEKLDSRSKNDRRYTLLKPDGTTYNPQPLFHPGSYRMSEDLELQFRYMCQVYARKGKPNEAELDGLRVLVGLPNGA